MVTVRVTRATEGWLAELVMRGHVSSAAGPRGANPVCAAVTGLVRSCAEVLADTDGVAAVGGAEREGELTVSVLAVDSARTDWARGVTDVLVTGLRRMAVDAPEEVEVRVIGRGSASPE